MRLARLREPPGILLSATGSRKLEQKRLIVVLVLVDSMAFDDIFAITSQPVDSQAVFFGLDYAEKTVFKDLELALIDAEFEYRELDPLSEVLAGLGDSSEPFLA